MSLISISTPINLYTTPLLISWQQFRPPEIHNHTCDSRSRHSTQAEAKVVPPLLLSTPFYSRVILPHSRSLCSHSACPWHMDKLTKGFKSLDFPTISDSPDNPTCCCSTTSNILWSFSVHSELYDLVGIDRFLFIYYNYLITFTNNLWLFSLSSNGLD